MARHGLIAVRAATAFGVLGVEAGPCRVSSRTSDLSTATTTSVELSSAATDKLSSTITESSVTVISSTETASTTEALSTDVSSTETASTTETLSTDVSSTERISTAETASTTDVSSTTETSMTITTETSMSTTETSSTVETTTTTTTAEDQPAPCAETQVLENPGFDDSSDGTPWVLGPDVTVSEQGPRTEPNDLHLQFNGGGTITKTFSQTLSDLDAGTYQLEYYIAMHTAVNGRGFVCQAIPTIGDEQLSGGPVVGDDGPSGWQYGTAYWTPTQHVDQADVVINVKCSGSYNFVIIAAEDFSLTRRCTIIEE
ncbi:hypothetical protein FDECE_18477 [Fusarium decemcellulare]|nr:hypothetical protein FDECE_18477 [Fusarium decemcellulare]